MATELEQLKDMFWITPLNLLPLAFLIVLSLKKVPPSLAITASAMVAGVLAAFLQPQVVLDFVDSPELSPPAAFVKGTWLAMSSGFQALSLIHI